VLLFPVYFCQSESSFSHGTSQNIRSCISEKKSAGQDLLNVACESKLDRPYSVFRSPMHSVLGLVFARRSSPRFGRGALWFQRPPSFCGTHSEETCMTFWIFLADIFCTHTSTFHTSLLPFAIIFNAFEASPSVPSPAGVLNHTKTDNSSLEGRTKLCGPSHFSRSFSNHKMVVSSSAQPFLLVRPAE